jgi:hypothetical protein
VSKNLILSKDLLSTCIETLAQDIINNQIKILNRELEPVNDEINDLWNKKSNYEVYLAVQDRLSYGFGALEIIFDNEKPAGFKQISAETLSIKVINHPDGNKSYYAHYNNGTEKMDMKLSRYNYTKDDDDLPTVLWLGGGRLSDFYDIPAWIPAFNKISANTLLDELNAKKISEGNLISGVLTVLTPPLSSTEVNDETGEWERITGKEKITNDLENQMQEAGTGMLVLHLEQLTSDLPLKVDYIPISESNYDYLLKLAEGCDNSILRLFKIPKVRLMIDDVKESMNSNKTSSIWEIYTKELRNKQREYESILESFIRKYYEIETNVTFEVPLFADKKDIEVRTAISLFDKGIIRLSEAIDIIQKYYPEIEFIKDDSVDGRYYHGQLLGMADYEKELNPVGDLYEFFGEE